LSVEWVESGPHRLACGDCRDVMPSLSPVDAIVTDPPYGLEFMGKEWDKLGGTNEHATDSPGWRAGHGGTGVASKNNGVPFGGGGNRIRYGKSAASMQAWHQAWAESALSCLKPGGYMLCFGGTRTFHRMACAIEDAGFEIRDCLMWMYGQGFPKAKSCLKPAWEPIILARKPGAKVLPLGIDECRIATDEGGERKHKGAVYEGVHNGYKRPNASCLTHKTDWSMPPSGRWPANVVHDGSDEVMEAFAAFGECHARGNVSPTKRTTAIFGQCQASEGAVDTGDTGTAARFYYCAKASKADRDEGLEGMPSVKCGLMQDDAYEWKGDDKHAPHNTARRNTHPTVKPTALMEWLIKLVARPGETVLDPFAGSGSTLKACARIGRHGIGIEKHRPYWEIAAKRTEAALKSEPLLEGVA
jgi:DNA modification methylase